MKQILTTSLVTMGLFFTSFYAEAKKTESLTCHLSALGLDSDGGHIFLNPHKVNGGYSLIIQTQVAQSLIDNNYNTKGTDVEPLCSNYQTYYNTDIQVCAINDGNAEGVYHVTIKMRDSFGVSLKTIALVKARKELKTNYLTNLDVYNDTDTLLYAPKYFQMATQYIQAKYLEYSENASESDLFKFFTSKAEFNQELLQMGLLQKGTILMIDSEPKNILCMLNK